MKVSVALTNYSWPSGPAAIARHVHDVAQQVDVSGIDTLWVADHLLQLEPDTSVDEPMLEAYSTLAYAAAVTRTVGLGTMVTCAPTRPPALLIKTVTTLDVLSGGRAWLGVGAGYRGDEAAMVGLPFGSTRERFALLEELLQLAAHMWDGDRSPFDGPVHRLDTPISSPQPIGRPRVLVGGMGEERTLPLVARYADACNLFDIPDGGATIRHKVEVLERACDAVGRHSDEIEVTLSTRLDPDDTAGGFVDHARTLAGHGVDHLVVLTRGPWTPDRLDVLADATATIASDRTADRTE